MTGLKYGDILRDWSLLMLFHPMATGSNRLMKQVISFGMIVALCLFFTLHSHAEVHVHQQELTAHVKKASLAKVLTKIGRQAGFDIAVLNESDYHKARVSDVLKDVPLEQGLARLLNGWNYGFSKDPTTGTVRQLIIVSRRTGVIETVSVATHFQTVSNRVEEADPDHRIEEQDIPGFVEEEPYLTDEDLLDNALPEVRELIMQMREQTDEQ